MNTIRKRRVYWIILLVLGSLLATFLVLKALRQNVNLFYTPTQIVAGEVVVKEGPAIRIGGMVQKKSLAQEEGLTVRFVITDFNQAITVQYTGILPDLFKEGQGVVVLGYLNQANQVFIADQVLAKHDENYMPPEVGQALNKNISRRTTP